VRGKLDAIAAYTPTRGVPEVSLLTMAKLAHDGEARRRRRRLDGGGEAGRVGDPVLEAPLCTVMSMMSDSLRPSACEVDVTGSVGTLILQAASGTPSAIRDWNNDYDDRPDKAVVFHCSNLPRHFLETVSRSFQEILAGTVGRERSCGTLCGQTKAEPVTYLRVGTDDPAGRIRGYVGEGRFSDDPIDTFGGYGVEVPRLQELLRQLCRSGFEHHVVVNLPRTAEAVSEALETYLGWDVYHHA
jgi:L-fucose isomerase-like protein